jgi:glycosyltransferase involved in cell wall biosynthesis
MPGQSPSAPPGDAGSTRRGRAPTSHRALHIAMLARGTSAAAGAIDLLIDTARFLSKRGHRVTLIGGPDARAVERCRASGMESRVLATRRGAGLVTLPRLNRLIAEIEADVLHVPGRTAHALALVIRRRGGLPAVVVERGTSFPPGRLAALVYRSRRVQRIVATCEHVRGVILSHTRLTVDRVEVVHMGIDPERFDPDACRPNAVRKDLGIAHPCPLVGHVGIHDWRGWKELLRAFPPVLARHPDAHLVLIGCRSEHQRRAVLEAAAEMGLSDRTAAIRAPDDPRDLLAACTIVVDPAWAGIGVSPTVVQAMALARPLVASGAGGTAELVERERSGLLVEPRDVASLAAAMIRLLDDPELAARLGRAARRRVCSRFTAAHRAARLEHVYRHAMRELRAARR